jgi:putative hydrolase of the HAD superfamily
MISGRRVWTTHPYIIVLVLFDIDDTLIDHASASRTATAAVHRHAKVAEPLDDFVASWSRALRHYFDLYLGGRLTFEEQRRARMRATVSSDLTDEEADRLFALYAEAYESAWSLFPDVTACLDSLAGHRLGIISNGQREQQVRKLKRSGVLEKFDCVVISEDCGHPKPKVEIFHYACSQAGESPGRTMYVGDRRDLDAVGARNAGLIGVWLNRDGLPAVDGDGLVIGSLRELPGLVDSAERGLVEPH